MLKGVERLNCSRTDMQGFFQNVWDAAARDAKKGILGIPRGERSADADRSHGQGDLSGQNEIFGIGPGQSGRPRVVHDQDRVTRSPTLPRPERRGLKSEPRLSIPMNRFRFMSAAASQYSRSRNNGSLSAGIQAGEQPCSTHKP